MINLHYETVGTELSCPEAVRYCFILLVSYYQQSQSTPTAPHTQSPLYITFIRHCTNVENIWWRPSKLCFLWGCEGLFWGRGPPAGPQCICSLGWTAVTPWGPLVFFSITFTLFYRFQFENKFICMFKNGVCLSLHGEVWVMLSNICF